MALRHTSVVPFTELMKSLCRKLSNMVKLACSFVICYSFYIRLILEPHLGKKKRIKDKRVTLTNMILGSVRKF